jgi:hypothetical protein
MEVSGQLHSPAALSPGKEPLVPTGWEAGWAQSLSGHGGEEKNSHPLRESNLRTPIVQSVAQRYTKKKITVNLNTTNGDV